MTSAQSTRPELFYALCPLPNIPRSSSPWIASRSLSSGARSRDPLARNDGSAFCVVDRLMTIERARDRRQRVFKTCGAIEQHHAITFRHASVGKTLLVGSVSGRTFRTQQQALFARDLVERSRNFLIAHRNGKTFTLPHRAQDKKIPDRLRHPDARCDGVGIFPARRVLGAALEGTHHRRAAGRLHRHHPWPFGADEADCLKFGERLPHADQAGAATGRIKDHVRYVPAELFDKLQPHRLLTLDTIRLLQRRGIEPTGLRLALSDDLAAIVDQSIDAVHGRALQLDLADFR